MKQHRRPAPKATYRRYAAVMAPAVRSVREPVSSKRRLQQAEAREWDRPRAVSASLVVLVALLSAWVGFGDTFYVPIPKVIGNALVPAEEIVASSGLTGLHVAWVSSPAIRSALLHRTPALREARVSCALPADCSIAVVEREPLFAWRWGQAQVWVDAAGIVFPAYGRLPDLLTIESSDVQLPQPGRSVDPKLLTAIVSIAQALPEVRAYRYSAARGLEFTDREGYPVYLGSGSNMADRVLVWRILRDDLAARSLKPAYVDVRFPLAPYYGK
ncbi:MAG TPA: cell division protein FtsQ/DivIB [Anaerolineae bacterium]|nr:cell division protein FtsQ/DivIB [Anaerolineae bacterium]